MFHLIAKVIMSRPINQFKEFDIDAMPIAQERALNSLH